MLGKTLDFKTELRTWKTKGTFEVPLKHCDLAMNL